MIQVKSAKEIEIMKKANQIAAEALIVAGNAIKPGMSTWELDKIIHDFIVQRRCPVIARIRRIYRQCLHICER